MTGAEFLAIVAPVALVVLGLGILLATVRIIIGPSLPDRVVAFDVITMLAMGMIVAYSIYRDQPAFIDVAIVLALVTFIATVAVANYLTRRTKEGSS